MIPNITRGGATARLMRYLVGHGRRDEHKDPRLVAGQPGTVVVEHGKRTLAPRDAGPIALLLDEPMRDFGIEVTVPEKGADGQPTGARRAAHVWHCSLALHPDEPDLDDRAWERIAQGFIVLLGFDPFDGTPACRWVAIRHGRSAGDSDHIHLVVNLVREDGKPASVHMDQRRAQQACRHLEEELGLHQVEGRLRGAGERGVKPAEVSARLTDGRRDPTRRIPAEHTARRQLERVVRACATAATDEREFVVLLRSEHVLVRPRFEKGAGRDVVGYSAALRPDDGTKPVWFGGGRLSRELTLPRLRAAWPELDHASLAGAWERSPLRDTRGRTATPPTPQLQAQCARQLAQLRERLQNVPYEDRTTWALVARDAAGILAAWSLRTEPRPGPLAEAGRAIARTAQLRTTHAPGAPRRSFPPTRTTAQLLLRAGTSATPNRLLLSRITSLTEAIHDMHAAAGEAQRAAELESSAAARLAAILPTLDQTPARPAQTLDPGSAASDRLIRTQSGRDSGSGSLDR